MIKKIDLPFLLDVVIEHRNISTELFDRVSIILNSVNLEKELSKYYQKGQNIDGRQSYSSIILFKMLLLQYWYGLSDESIEENVKDCISFSEFCGIAMDEQVPIVEYYQANDTVLKDKKLKNRVKCKALKNKPLNEIEKKINKKISQTRYKMERTFGSMKRWFKAENASYVGVNQNRRTTGVASLMLPQPIPHKPKVA
jgi:Transposase domain (DUF772)/Transposase DDE domain